MYKTTVLSFLCAACAVAQVNTSIANKAGTVRMAEPIEFGVTSVTGAMMGPAGKIAGSPYSAEVVTQRLQILADGNRIEQTTTGSVARDGQGRVRRDETLPALPGGNGEGPHLVMIDDPVGQVHWTLDAQTKTATKMPMPPMPPGKPGASFTMADPAAGVAMTAVPKADMVATAGVPMLQSFSTTMRLDGSDGAKTDLGTQPVEGVPARGTRITRTIEAGQMGNALPIVITTETWFSPDLKVLVSSKSSDPRIGDTTYKLTNIQRAEPDPALFQVPADYTVHDQPENTFFYRTVKKEE